MEDYKKSVLKKISKSSGNMSLRREPKQILGLKSWPEQEYFRIVRDGASNTDSDSDWMRTVPVSS